MHKRILSMDIWENIIFGNGNCLNSQLFQDVYFILNILHSLKTTYHPQASKQKEQNNWTLKAAVTGYLNSQPFD